jgi:hypothetical protein
MLIKQVYFLRTARGDGRDSRTRLVPIAIMIVGTEEEGLLAKLEVEDNKTV